MRVVVGRIGRAHALRGELTVEVRTDVPEERFSPGAVVHLSGRAGLPDQVTITGRRWQNDRLVLSLEGIVDRTAAEALRGAMVEADVDLTDTSGEEYHDLALVGLAVKHVEGTVLGQVREVLHLPGQDVLAVERPDGGEVLVPFVRALVPEVDLGSGHLLVDLPDGLMELS